MDEETSDATVQSESPGPRAPADGGPILNRARACCLPDCRAADVAVVAFWLVCLACFLAGLWERTMLPMRSKSRADPIYYTGIVMIAVGTLVLLCYFVVRLERVRSAARTPFSPIPQAARPPGSVASSNRLLAYRLSSTGRTLLSRSSGLWAS